MIYAHYDAKTGRILGFYDSGIHDSIPEPNVELTEEQWQTALSGSYRIVDGELAKYVHTPTQAELDAARTLEIRAELAAIDAQSIRAARAVSAALAKGATPEGEDVARLTELETRAEALRGELKSLNGAA